MMQIIALLSACLCVSADLPGDRQADQGDRRRPPRASRQAVLAAGPRAAPEKATARPTKPHVPRGVHPRPRQAYVPPPPVIDIDPSVSLPSDLPTVLSSSDVERYQRIVAAQAGGNWAAADADIRELRDKTLLGYMLAQRYLQASYRSTPDELASWLREYNDHPDAPAVYRLASARRVAGLTPSSFVSAPRNGHAIAPDTPAAQCRRRRSARGWRA